MTRNAEQAAAAPTGEQWTEWGVRRTWGAVGTVAYFERDRRAAEKAAHDWPGQLVSRTVTTTPWTMTAEVTHHAANAQPETGTGTAEPAKQTRRKTGGMGGVWVAYGSPKPPPVADHYAYWSEAPPEQSARCTWWLRQIDLGWRPNRRIRAENYDSSAAWYGVYIWEYLRVIAPALSLSGSPMSSAQS